MFLKPFVADRWILVSSPSPNREAEVAVSGSRGLVASSFLSSVCRGRAGCGRRCKSRPCRAVWRRPGTGVMASGVGHARQVRDGDDGARCRATSGSGSARVDGGRCHSGPTGDGDNGAEGGSAQAAVLGAEAAVQNEKMNQSQSELCGSWGERSSALV
jgi:hypothetical protein